MEKRDQHPAFSNDFKFLDQISAAALANILLSKGVVTAEELLHAERVIRQSPESFEENNTGWKKVVSRHRLVRRITHRLFGWQWKKQTPTQPRTRRSELR